MDDTKTIYLARHAKSAWDTGAPTDYDRPLNERGVVDAGKIGEALYQQSWFPEKIIASTAVRAKQTTEFLCDEINFSLNDVEWNKEFYAAYMVTLLHSLTSQPESVKSVMLLGHNPAMEDLLLHLCRDAMAHRQKNRKLFTTCNVIKITVQTPWKDLVMCDATLVKILRPKEL